jgi:predicted metalloprotease with PDZ domain
MKVSVVALCFIVVTVASPSQQKPPRYFTGATIVGSASCPDNPVFVGGVFPISPAASGGLTVGDRLLSIDGRPVKNLQDAAARMSSTSPGTVILKVKRNGSVHILSVGRDERTSIWSRNGLRILDDGLQVGTDYTDAEIEEYRSVNRDLD